MRLRRLSHLKAILIICLCKNILIRNYSDNLFFKILIVLNIVTRLNINNVDLLVDWMNMPFYVGIVHVKYRIREQKERG